MKVCTKCSEPKRDIEFGSHPKTKDGLKTYCKPCYAHYNRFRLYGLTQVQFEAMRRKQRNKCLICKDSLSDSPHVDHNHDTGKVRGLLCRPCNTAIGQLADNPLVVLQAAHYLVTALMREA